MKGIHKKRALAVMLILTIFAISVSIFPFTHTKNNKTPDSKTAIDKTNPITGFAIQQECQNRWFDEYECQGKNLVRKHLFNDCSSDWVFIQECPGSCTNGVCQPIKKGNIACYSDSECGIKNGCYKPVCKTPGTILSYCNSEIIAECQTGDDCCPSKCQENEDLDCIRIRSSQNNEDDSDSCDSLTRLECKMSSSKCYQRYKKGFFGLVSVFDSCVDTMCESLDREQCKEFTECEAILKKRMGFLYFFDKCVEKT